MIIVDKIKRRMNSYKRQTSKFILRKIVYPLVYKWHSRKPIDEKLVLFADQQYLDMPDNFAGLYKLFEREGYRCELLLMPPDLMEGSEWNWSKRNRKQKFCFRFLKLWARSKALFLINWFPMAYVVPVRKETTVVQLWHACGIMKMWGYSTENKPWGADQKQNKRYSMHTNYTIASVSAPKCIAPYEDAFRCKKGIVQALGVPRTDIYFDEEFKKSARKNLLEKFPEIGERKIILYAPTFRGNSIAKSKSEVKLNFELLKESLSEKYAFVLKLHPLVSQSGFTESKRLASLGFAFDGSKCLTPEEALCAADILITDYSSIMFEYFLLERPVISYIYDIDKYLADRGLYFPYEELAPGPYVFTQEKLIEKLQTVDEWFDIERIRKYKQEYMSACDGHSTERIFNYVFGKKNEGEEK